MARWENTLDIQMDLWRFWASDQGHSFGRTFAASLNRKALEYAAKGLVEERPADVVKQEMDWTWHLAEIEKNKLLNAEPIFVSDDVMTILEAAEPTFKPEPLQREDLITQQGFVYFPRPFTLVDVNGVTLAWRAMSWCPVHSGDNDGIVLTLYSSFKDTDEDVQTAEHVKKMEEKGEHWPCELILLHVTPWWFGEEMRWHTDPDVPGTMSSTARQFQVFHKIAGQMITSRGQQRLPRPHRKRAQKAKMKFNEAITVITLRRKKPKKDEPEERPVDWQQRWIVHGHWRWQWYPSLGMHKQKWISDYVKGPEDKDLVIKKRVFEFTE